MKNIVILSVLLFAACSTATTPTASTTFVNPVIFADVPDPDVIRVGEDFYMVSTTMHLMPGVPIMHSRDLVNWEIISYAVEEIKDSPLYDLEGGNVYGKGQWATSLRYHDGRFYLLFATNNPQKTYIYIATDPAGEWQKIMDIDTLLHDTSLLFDGDGRVYAAGGSGGVRVRELRSDLTGLKEDGLDVQLFRGNEIGLAGLLEGSHIQKINGRYYIFMIWWPAGGVRTQLAFRSDSLTGPYEHRVILSDTLDLRGAGVAQGNIVDTPDGRWYGMLFQDHGAVGRVPVLVPCRWIDGWPMLGYENGRVPKVMEKPVQGYPATPLVVSDEFSAPTLGLTWEWNHNPDNALWSLSERPGYMRLRTGKVVETIFEARNMLSQRTEGRMCSGVVALDVANMKEGDVAGLAAYCAEPGTIAVVAEGGKKYLVMTDRGEEKQRVELTKERVYLRVDCDFTDRVDEAKFYYSLNNRKWTQLGEGFKMVYNLRHFMGNRFGIFNYATLAPGGYVDVDFFHYTPTPEKTKD
jgi:arabinoxylan arabinofuranohydrolase